MLAERQVNYQVQQLKLSNGRPWKLWVVNKLKHKNDKLEKKRKPYIFITDKKNTLTETLPNDRKEQLYNLLLLSSVVIRVVG